MTYFTLKLSKDGILLIPKMPQVIFPIVLMKGTSLLFNANLLGKHILHVPKCDVAENISLLIFVSHFHLRSG